MRRHFDDFDQEFKETKRTIRRYQAIGIVISIIGSFLMFALVAVVIYAIGQFAGLW